MSPRILVFGASSSRHSINRALARHAADRLVSAHVADASIELIDLNDYEMPIFSVDRERDGGIPAPARRFFEQIGAADALLISYAEHNGHYTAAFKNVFDWASRISQKVFQDTPMVVMATSPGRNGGANVLAAALRSAPHFGAEVVGSLSVPRFREAFDTEQGALTDPVLAEQLDKVLGALALRLREVPA